MGSQSHYHGNITSTTVFKDQLPVSSAPGVSLQKALSWDESVSSNFSTTLLSQIFNDDSKTTIIKPSALDIVWGKDSRYWRLPTRDDAPAELLQVSWVEVSGSLDLSTFEEKKNYKLCFKVSLQSDAFGWQGSPVYMMVKVGQGRQKWKKFDLGTAAQNTPIEIPADLKFEVPAKDKQGSGEKLRFGLYEIWRGRWKGGLVIHEVRITRED